MQIILSRSRGSLCALEHVTVEEAHKVRRMGRDSREDEPREDREMCLKSESGGEKNGVYKVQEAEGANCQIRARRMKRERKRARMDGRMEEVEKGCIEKGVKKGGETEREVGV